MYIVDCTWLGQFCWTEIVKLLKEKGAKVITLDLPAHGDDQSPAESVSLESYCKAVIEAVANLQNVVLVGHIMTVMVISTVADTIPYQISALVYLAAYLPRDSESLYQLFLGDNDSRIGNYWRQEYPEHYTPDWIASEVVVEVFGGGIALKNTKNYW